MTRYDIKTLLWTLAILAIGNLVGLFITMRLYNNRIILIFGLEIAWILIAAIPAAIALLVIFLRGHRSGYLFWVFLPGVLIWVMRPWSSGRSGWRLVWIREHVEYYGKDIFKAAWNKTTPEDASIAGLVGIIVVSVLFALITGSTIKQLKKDMRSAGRSGRAGMGGIGGGGGGRDRSGLPQASWAVNERAKLTHLVGYERSKLTHLFC